MITRSPSAPKTGHHLHVSDQIPLASFAEHAIIIPMLFEKETIIENLVCTSPVMYL